MQQRETQSAFLARGMLSLANARKSGNYIDVVDVLARLEDKLALARLRHVSGEQKPR